MIKPDLTVSLVQCSAELQRAHIAAVQAGRHDLADAIREEGIRVLRLIGLVQTGRGVEVVA